MNAQPSFTPVRKGKLVAIELSRSSTSLKSGTKRWSEWRFAVVAHATREGLATFIQCLDEAASFQVRRAKCQVFAIPDDLQPAARVLAGSLPRGFSYSSQAEIRHALKDMHDDLQRDLEVA